MIRVGFKSNPGLRREKNEDSYFVLPKENVFIVADGVGGSNKGEVASRTAVTQIAEYIRKHSIENIEGNIELARYFSECIRVANKAIYDMGTDHPEYFGMATTLVMCYIRDNFMYVVNVGDSRAYIFRSDELFQITEDHTYVNSLVKMGVITEEEAKNHEKGHMITRALGPDKEVEPDFFVTELKDEDRVILCTDGLYGEVEIDDMEDAIKEEISMSKLASELVDLANKAGGSDNITVICLKLEGGFSNEY